MAMDAIDTAPAVEAVHRALGPRSDGQPIAVTVTRPEIRAR
jgi:hypothetical protein